MSAAAAHAAASIASARAELLYAQDANPDCSKLHAKTNDPNLPFYVTRLHAVVDGAPAGVPLRYRWTLSAKAEGLLAADEDLGPSGTTPAVAGMCAEFGNACILTADKQKFYNEPTVFFVAPTCDVLPDNTGKAFRGGTSKVRLKVTAGKRKVGKATATIGWGRNGAVTIYARNTLGQFDDGLRKPNGVNVPAVTVTGANITTPPNPEPPGGLRTFFFMGNVKSTESNSCPSFPQFAACAELDLLTAGHAIPSVEARYVDGSALCDKIEVRTGPCAPRAKLEIIPSPKAKKYDPDSARTGTVDLTIRLRNVSRPENGLPACSFLLRGAGVLSCTEDIALMGLKDTKATQFDLKHCSQTTTQGCLANGDCAVFNCSGCQPNETCLTQSHCSQHFDRLCQNDEDCDSTGSAPPCPECQPDETCIHVLDVPSGFEIGIPPGQSFDLLHETVKMRNKLPDTAKITDTWRASVFIPQVSAEAKLKYKIRGRP